MSVGTASADTLLHRAARICMADARLRPVPCDPEALARITMAQCAIDGRAVACATDMERDPIRRRHRNGTFLAAEELAHGHALPAASKHCRDNRTFLCLPEETP